MSGRLVIGSRGSRLALAQAHAVADTLRRAHGEGLEVEVVTFTTRGDRILDKPLPEVGGKGLFTAELEAALHAGEVDIAVHSLKDLPVDQPEGLALLAIPERADARDALVLRADHLEALARSLAEDPEGFEPRDLFAGLPEGAVVGTSSLRRAAQLRRRRPDVQVRDVRGNLDTRLRKLDEGQYDALLLACAGLDRLGLSERVHRRLDRGWLGAAGQGALGIQGRADDLETALLLRPVEHRPTRLAVEAERTVLGTLQGGCSVPLAAWARVTGDRIELEAAVLSEDGGRAAEARRIGEATREGAARVGRTLARDLLDRGAAVLLEEARAAADAE